MKYDVSVIIPVYNRERLIKNALNSVLKQTIADRLEIICVDDGSTDKTVEVIKEYQKKHENIFLFQQENSGPGIARNLGIDNAHGEYIIFLDSDDWVPERAYELLLNYAREKDADVIVGKMLRKIKGIRNNQWYSIDRYDELFEYIQDKNCADSYLVPVIMTSPWNKIIKTSLIKENHIKFPDERLAEDFIFGMYVFKYAKKVFLLNEVVYMYESNLQESESLVSQIKPEIIDSGINCLLESIQFFYEEDIYTENQLIIGLFDFIYTRFIKLEESITKNEIFEKIKKYLSHYKGRKEFYIPIQFVMKIDLDTLLHLPYKAYKLQVELLEKMNKTNIQQVEKYVDRWKSNGNAERELAEVRKSLSWRIGSAIMWLPCKIGDLFKRKNER